MEKDWAEGGKSSGSSKAVFGSFRSKLWRFVLMWEQRCSAP